MSGNDSTGPRSGRPVAWLIAGILVVGVALRALSLENMPALSGDEAWYSVRAATEDPLSVGTLRTPTGRLASPAWFYPVVALQSVFGMSPLVLRGLALGCGLAAILAFFFLVRSAFGTRAGRSGLVLAASLPALIAYSRIGWEPALIPLASIAVLWLSFRGGLLGLAAAGAGAVLVHPVLVFLLPLAAAPAAQSFLRARGRGGRWLLASAAVAFLLTLGVLLVMPLPATFDPARALPLAFTPPAIGLFASGFARMLTGLSVYRHFTGYEAPAAVAVACDVALWSAIVSAIVVGLRKLTDAHRDRFVALLVGLGSSLLLFYFVAGPGAFSPEYERYALWVVVPTAIVLVAPWSGLVSGIGRRATGLATAAVAVTFLVHFAVAYPGHLRRTGGTSHRTFRTGPVDPKRAAAAAIRDAAGPGEAVRVLVEDYWLEWPVRFYLGAGSGHEVVNLEDAAADRSRVFADAMREGAFLVVHDGGAMHRALGDLFTERSAVRTWTFDDYAGRPVVRLARDER